MPQVRPRCLFCGAEGASDEDVIPKWIGRALSSTIDPSVRYVFRHRSEHPEAGIPRREKSAKLPREISRAFCRGCNGGWMSQLEQRTKPILEPLILGTTVTLSTADQQLLASWATKTLLAFQSIEHPTTKWARAEDYAALYKRQEPLPNSQVWLGANDHGEPAWQRAHSFQLPGTTPPAIDGFGATLTIGHAVFYLLIGYDAPVGLRLLYDAAFALKEIWPGTVRELSWPPRILLPKNPKTGLVGLVREHSVIRHARGGASNSSFTIPGTRRTAANP